MTCRCSYPSVRPSVCWYTHTHTHTHTQTYYFPCMYPFISMYLSIYVFIYLSLYLFAWLYITPAPFSLSHSVCVCVSGFVCVCVVFIQVYLRLLNINNTFCFRPIQRICFTPIETKFTILVFVICLIWRIYHKISVLPSVRPSVRPSFHPPVRPSVRPFRKLIAWQIRTSTLRNLVTSPKCRVIFMPMRRK